MVQIYDFFAVTANIFRFLAPTKAYNKTNDITVLMLPYFSVFL